MNKIFLNAMALSLTLSGVTSLYGANANSPKVVCNGLLESKLATRMLSVDDANYMAHHHNAWVSLLHRLPRSKVDKNSDVVTPVSEHERNLWRQIEKYRMDPNFLRALNPTAQKLVRSLNREIAKVVREKERVRKAEIAEKVRRSRDLVQFETYVDRYQPDLSTVTEMQDVALQLADHFENTHRFLNDNVAAEKDLKEKVRSYSADPNFLELLEPELRPVVRALTR